MEKVLRQTDDWPKYTLIQYVHLGVMKTVFTHGRKMMCLSTLLSGHWDPVTPFSSQQPQASYAVHRPLSLLTVSINRSMHRCINQSIDQSFIQSIDASIEQVGIGNNANSKNDASRVNLAVQIVALITNRSLHTPLICFAKNTAGCTQSRAIHAPSHALHTPMTCKPRFMTCQPRSIKCNPHSIICNPHFITCNPESITCNAHSIHSTEQVMCTCRLHHMRSVLMTCTPQSNRCATCKRRGARPARPELAATT